MKIIVNGFEYTNVVNAISWDGDLRSIARKVSFSIPEKDADYYFSRNINLKPIHEGGIVELKTDEDKLIFKGIIIDMDKTLSGGIIKYTAFDFMFYLKNSELSKVFDTTAEVVAKQVANELGIETLNIANTGVNVYMACLPENAYNIIMMAYTKASQTTGKKYIPVMDDDKLSVYEIGLDSQVLLDPTANIEDVTYKISLSELTNKVLVLDKAGKVISTIEDKETIKKYGTVQKTCKGNTGEAKAMLKSVKRSLTVKTLGDIRAVTGKSLLLKDPETEIVGKYYIEADSHSFSNGVHEMSLTLNLEKVMDEKEIKK